MPTVNSILQSTQSLPGPGARHGSSCEQTMLSLLLPPASVANSVSIADQGITTHVSPRLRYESGRSLQRSSVRFLILRTCSTGFSPC